MLDHLRAKFGAALRALAKDNRGVAAVEFTLILPFMLLLYLGTIELADLIAVDRKVTIISGTVGDLVARTDGSIASGTTLQNYFKAADGIIVPYSSVGLKQVVTLVAVDKDGNTSVTWSRGYNGGTAYTTGQSFVLPAAMTNISKESWVVVSETSYSYKPLLGMVVTTAVDLHRESYYLPRYGKIINIT